MNLSNNAYLRTSNKQKIKRMIVCIAEKPSVGRDIAQVLGATQAHDGYMEGNGYQVTWTFGHLCELKEPHEYSDLWKRWSLSVLPMLPARFGIKLKADKGIEKQFGIIKGLALQAEMIVNCGDAGQEGELIQRWVIQKTGAKCPVKRLWINSLTEEAIREGFSKLRDQQDYDSLYEAGLSRAIGDWTLGINATRLYTLKYRPHSQSDQILSIGRVQTPTLALIVKRQLEIANFQPVPYWVLSTTYRQTLFTAVMEEGSRGFSSLQEGNASLAAIAKERFEITDVQKKKGSEAPPRLFDLTGLQVACNKRFGFSADLTLQLIQSLYEKKLTTYPRVDTTFLSEDIYPKCPQILNGLRSYFPLMERIKGKALLKSKKVFDNKKVTDHHAIIPTGETPKGITESEAQVYDLVCRRFIGIFFPDSTFESTTILGRVAEVNFKATGRRIIDASWKTLWGNTEKEGETEEEEQTLQMPAFRKGEGGAHIPSLSEKQTSAPKPYTEATLLRAMETAGRMVEDERLRESLKENGIGRPSTRAAIIETLFRRRYIRKERKNLVATPTGIALIELIKNELLKSAELTGHWEYKLRLIERKQYCATEFVSELKDMVRQLVEDVLADTHNRPVETQ